MIKSFKKISEEPQSWTSDLPTSFKALNDWLDGGFKTRGNYLFIGNCDSRFVEKLLPYSDVRYVKSIDLNVHSIMQLQNNTDAKKIKYSLKHYQIISNCAIATVVNMESFFDSRVKSLVGQFEELIYKVDGFDKIIAIYDGYFYILNQSESEEWKYLD